MIHALLGEAGLLGLAWVVSEDRWRVPWRTVVMTGDGGFFLNMGELWTAVQEKLDLAVVVMNDRGYGVIKRIQDATAQGRRFYADLQGPDLAGLAALAGMPFFKVTQADAFGPTIARALEHRGPSLTEVDMTAVGEFPAYYPFNQLRG